MRTIITTLFLSHIYVSLAGAADPVPLGPEFGVSSGNTQFTQAYAWIDCDDDGNFAAGYSVNDIWVRLFDRDGNALTDDLSVNGFQAGDQNETFVARDPISGDFMVCYTERTGQDGSGQGCYGRFYEADGTPYGDARLLNVNTNESQFEPHATYDINGRVFVVWTDADPAVDGSAGCVGRIFDRFGNDLSGGEFLINTASTKTQIDPTVAASREGRFVVAFVDASGDTGAPREVLARIFDPSGNPLGGQFLVNSDSAGEQREPSVAVAADGDFVVAWHDESGADGDGLGVFARRFDKDGNPKGAQFVVSQTTSGNQEDPHVDMDYVGNFIVTWSSDHGGDFDVYMRRFDRAGDALGGEVRVHETTAGDQRFAKSIYAQSGGRIISTFIGADSLAYARVFDVPAIRATGDAELTGTVTLDLDFPGMGGESYYLLPSLGTSPSISINGGRTLDLEADAMMIDAAQAPDAPPFSGLFGILDANGHGQVTFTVPNESSFFGSSVYFAGLTTSSGSLNINDLQSSQQSGVEYLSDPFELVIGGPQRVYRGQKVAGEISSSSEDDRAAFEAVKGQTIKLKALPLDPATQVGDKVSKLRVEIVDEDGDVVDVWKTKIPKAGKKGDKYKLKLKQSGRYFLQISGNKGAVGHYRFKFSAKMPKSAKEKTKKLKVGDSGDVKLGFTAVAEATLSVEVKPLDGAAVPSTIEVLDPDGGVVNTPLDVVVQGTSLMITDLALPATGKYKARVPGPNKAKYKVTVSPVQPKDTSVITLE